MTLIPLNRKNFVHNQVEVRPSIDFVSASSFFNNYKTMLLDSSNKTIGGVRAIGTFSPKIKEISEYFFEQHPNNTRITEFNNSFKDGLGVEDYLNKANKVEALCCSVWEFGIDRIQQRYMPYDVNLFKKETVKNTLNTANLTSNSGDYVENPRWSFSNYNSINFFTIGKGEEEKTGFSDSITHTNGIVYPNIENQYDFSGNSYSISFWINPRYKQPVGQEKNNGCILNIPRFISIYQAKGISKDTFGVEDKFRLIIQLDKLAYKALDLTNINFSSNINQFNSLGDGTFEMVTEECLSYNCWHNVIVEFNHLEDSNNNVKVRVYVDNKIVGNEFGLSQNKQNYTNNINNFICIGNKIVLADDGDPTLTAKVNSLFASQSNDLNSPGLAKFISAGDEKELPDVAFVDIENIFNSDRNSSYALEAELHDIRIYKNNFDEEKRNDIFKHGIKNLDVEKEKGLIFYIPVYFVPDAIKKKTYVNAFKDESARAINTTFDFVTNPYYFNNCGGHQVSTELFLLEWCKNSRPNIILGNRINNDYKGSIIEELTDTHVLGSQPYLDSTLGHAYHEMYLSQSLTSNQPSIQTGSFIYNNNLIMPCDNGLQNQYFNIIKENFEDNDFFYTFSYYTDKKYSEVSVENSFNPDKLKANYPFKTNVTYNSFKADENLQKILLHPHEDTIYKDVSYDVYSGEEKEIKLPHKESLFNISNINYQQIKDYKIYLGNYSPKTDGQTYFEEEYEFSNPATRDYSLRGTNHSRQRKGKFLNDYVHIQNIFPLYKVSQNPIEFHSIIFNISNQLYNRKIRKNTFSIKDYDLFGTGNTIKVNLKDSGRGMVYRADSFTKHAKWNHVGHILYSSGFCTVLHPSLYNFGKTNFRAKFEGENAVFVSEVNIPIVAGLHNKTSNLTYDEEIRASESAYEQDNKFVYISEINLHDESLNIVARAKLAQPVVKRENDNLVFRLKMDY